MSANATIPSGEWPAVIADGAPVSVHRVESGPHAGKLLVVYNMLYNHRLCLSSSDNLWIERSFCFPKGEHASRAAETWDGTGDPVGPWIKEPTANPARYGPGSKRDHHE